MFSGENQKAIEDMDLGEKLCLMDDLNKEWSGRGSDRWVWGQSQL